MSYLLRLVCVCLASFFLVHVATGLLVLSFSTAASRLALRMRAAAGARLLFSLRLLPVSLSTLIVALFCVPSYLRFEQDASESIGYPCLILALCGMALILAVGFRLLWAFASARALNSSSEAGDSATTSLFALVGFLRPRVVISQRIHQVLSDGQLEAALLHEEAHRQAHDNLKRLAMVAAPGVLPLHPTFRNLEEQWARLAEWAADDAAVADEPIRAIDLAEALVRVARLSSRTESFPLFSALVSGNDDLGERVHRLLNPGAAVREVDASHSTLRPTAIVATLATAIVVLLVPHRQDLLYVVHCAMEFLVR